MIRNDAETKVHIHMCVFVTVCTAGVFISQRHAGGSHPLRIFDDYF